MSAIKTILTFAFCLLTVSCGTMTPQEAEDYLQGRWQFHRGAKERGYLSDMRERDDLFMSFSGREMTTTYVEEDEVVAQETNTIGLIRVDDSGVIEVWGEEAPASEVPDCTFKKLDANHLFFGMYDFSGPMRRMESKESIPHGSQ